MPPKVAIIGAGIAGLSTASYLQRNGFDTEIHELHDKPGGLCAAWERKGFTFDGCIHWLMGSGPSSNLHELWKELGAGDLEYIEWEEHVALRLRDGGTFTVYTDPDRLEAEILRLGPDDGAVAGEIARGVRRASRIDLPAAFDKLGWAERARFLGHSAGALPLALDFKRPVSALVAGMKSPALREAFGAFFGAGMDGFPVAALYLMLGAMAKGSAGYPIGGSRAFARAIEAKYLSLGGTIRYGSRIDEILVEGGRAVGVRGSAGESRADYVVSAGDARDALKRLLGGRYAMPALDGAFEGRGALKPYPSLLFFGLGLGRDCRELPHGLSLPLAAPLVLEGGALKVDRITLRTFNFDPSLAPPGKVSAVVMLETRGFDHWNGLAERDRAAYAAAKKAAGEALVAAIDRSLPGFASAVEVVDVATPRTFARYTNNWLGSYEGWLPGVGSFGRSIPRKVPGLDRLRLVGQWVNPGGGLPPCAIDGRRLAKELCRSEGRRFSPD